MKNYLIAIVFIFGTIYISQAKQNNSPEKTAISTIIEGNNPVDHSIWNSLLKKYVNEKGMVNYKGFIKDSVKLNSYLEMLSKNPPNKKTWSKNAQLAYWLNAYNAFTVKLITEHYPVKSIKDIAGNIPFVNTPWDVKFIHIGDETYDLNNLEHGIIRKQFDEERIHFAVVCAAMSCPPLRNEAYTAEKLNEQLNDQAKKFFNQGTQNKITANEAQLSSILKWYGGDFKDKAPSMREYVNKYSKVKIKADAKIDYLKYNWALNEQQ